MKEPEKTILPTSKLSIVGLFATLTVALTIPLVVLLAQEPQDIRQRAAEPIPTISLPAQTQGTGFISGYVYYDMNKNGERDNNERPFSGATVVLTEVKQDQTSDVVTNYKTDANGYFAARFTNVFPQTGSYILKLSLPDQYKTINTNPLVLPNQQKDIKKVIEFGLFPVTIPTIVPTSRVKLSSPSPTLSL